MWASERSAVFSFCKKQKKEKTALIVLPARRADPM
jgi:hypothetical protein